MFRLARTLHNWFGLLLAVQITLWFLSGLVMTLLPINEVRGTHLTNKPQVAWSSAAVSPADILKQHPNGELSFSQRIVVPSSLQNTPTTSQPVYVVSEDEQTYRYNANTGVSLAPLEDAQIRAMALAQYNGVTAIHAIQKFTVLPQEVSHLTPPLWQVTFSDPQNTRFYLDPNTGSVVRVRTDTWRLFDFMWMLHIMDYDERTNFNHPLLIGFAGSALLFALSGILLLIHRFRPRRRQRIFY